MTDYMVIKCPACGETLPCGNPTDDEENLYESRCACGVLVKWTQNPFRIVSPLRVEVVTLKATTVINERREREPTFFSLTNDVRIVDIGKNEHESFWCSWFKEALQAFVNRL